MLSLQGLSGDEGSIHSIHSVNRYQRSIPVHKRSYYSHNHNVNSTNSTSNTNSTNVSLGNNSNYGGFFSVTSSTRSVKSVGSSIMDTEDDRSQTGISFMSQDYCNIDEKSVLSKGEMSIPRIVPRGIHEEEDDVEEDDDEEEENNNADTVVVPPLPTSGFTMNMMDKYMAEMKTTMEKGFQQIKLQNQRDHEKGEFIIYVLSSLIDRKYKFN